MSQEGSRGKLSKQHSLCMKCNGVFHEIILCAELYPPRVVFLRPDITSLMEHMSKLKKLRALGSTFAFAGVCQGWVEKLNTMSLHCCLSKNDALQLLSDFRNGFSDFKDVMGL